MIAGNFWNGPQLGNVEVVLVGKFHLDSRLEICMDFWLEICSLIPDGASGMNLAWKL